MFSKFIYHKQQIDLIGGAMNEVYHEIERKFLDSMAKKTVYFVSEALRNSEKIMENEKHLIFSLINLQLAAEFALKGAIVHNSGLLTIVQKKDVSEDEIITLYKTNNLKIKEFDKIKNQAKANSFDYAYTSEMIRTTEKFQNYRNRLVHSIYNFDKNEILNLEKEIYSYFFEVINFFYQTNKEIFKQNTEGKGYLVEYLDNDVLQKLQHNRLYQECLTKYIKTNFNTDSPLTCVLCENEAITPDLLCLSCLASFDIPEIYGFTLCDYCCTKTAIYDELNHLYDAAFCLKCGEKVPICQCEICNKIYNILLGHDCK